LVNLPVGITVFALSLRLLPDDRPEAGDRRLDVGGAVTVTAAVMLGTYAVINGNENGWTSGETVGLLAAATALLAFFLVLESRVGSPLMPLGLFRLRNISVANVVGVLLAGSMFGWFFLSALYLQLVLGYNPLEVGLAYLPSTLIMAAGSIALSDRLVMRFGVKPPIVGGLSCFAIGLLWFARAPADGSFVVDVLPAMLVMGIGGGITFNPLLLAAMGDVAPTESGLASGIVNTAFMMGGALGLAVLVSVADSRTQSLLDSGDGQAAALTGGYNAAFLVAGGFAVIGALGALLLRPAAPPRHGEMPEAPAVAEPVPESSPV
jgi:Major Facilitator Superfamily